MKAIHWFGACLLVVSSLVLADTYPSKPIRLVVPYPAGQGTDVMARAIGDKLAEALGKPVVVDNRPGAGGNIGTEVAARAASDGYTLIMGTNATHAMNASLYSSVPFDHIRDFAPVALVGTLPLMIVAHPSAPASSPKELVDLARARPGGLNFGFGSTSGRVAIELFKRNAGVDVVPVSYRGATAVLTDLMGGQIQYAAETVATVLPHVKAGKIKAIAVTSSKRTQLAPDVPTVQESGLSYEVVGWNALFAPRGTPPEIVQRLNAEVNRVVQTAEVRTRMASIGFDPASGSPADLATFVRTETDKWSQIIKAAGLRAD